MDNPAISVRPPPPPTGPVTVIEAGTNSWSADVAETWSYRELLFFLVWRDLRVRYRQTLLGALWAILQPLASMAVLTLVFGRLSSFAPAGTPYPLFAYSGLVLWTFFANAVTAASNSLVNSAYLVTKVYFPRVIIPAASVLGAAVDFALGLLPLALMMAWYGVKPAAAWPLALLPCLATLALALGVGSFLAAVNVRFRDVRHAVPFAIQIWMLATPTFYPMELIPAKWEWLAALNPVTGVVLLFRSLLIGTPLDAMAVRASALVTLLALMAGLWFFRKTERGMADTV